MRIKATTIGDNPADESTTTKLTGQPDSDSDKDNSAAYLNPDLFYYQVFSYDNNPLYTVMLVNQFIPQPAFNYHAVAGRTTLLATYNVGLDEDTAWRRFVREYPPLKCDTPGYFSDGWISRNGDFYPCSYAEHSYLARRIGLALYGSPEGDIKLEYEGWVRFKATDGGFYRTKKLTVSQQNKIIELAMYIDQRTEAAPLPDDQPGDEWETGKELASRILTNLREAVENDGAGHRDVNGGVLYGTGHPLTR